jgi:hypothetical protein
MRCVTTFFNHTAILHNIVFPKRIDQSVDTPPGLFVRQKICRTGRRLWAAVTVRVNDRMTCPPPDCPLRSFGQGAM